MAWMEKKLISQETLQSLLNDFAQALMSKFELTTIETEHGDIRCFIDNDGEYFYPAYMYGGANNEFHCLVVEYAGTEEEIKEGAEEEGGQYFPEDYDSKEAMFQAMLEEIES